MRGEPGDYLFPPNTRFRVMSIQSSTPNEPAEARLIELPPVDPILSFEREPASTFNCISSPFDPPYVLVTLALALCLEPHQRLTL